MAPGELPNPWLAAGSSFLAFTVGCADPRAALPVRCHHAALVGDPVGDRPVRCRRPRLARDRPLVVVLRPAPAGRGGARRGGHLRRSAAWSARPWPDPGPVPVRRAWGCGVRRDTPFHPAVPRCMDPGGVRYAPSQQMANVVPCSTHHLQRLRCGPGERDDTGVTMRSAIPAPQGLYDPEHEHDACGVAFVAHAVGGRSPTTSSSRRSPRCATSTTAAPTGAEPDSGDGAGILIQVPDAFFRAVLADGVDLPPRRSYAVGIAFLPDDDEAERDAPMRAIEAIAAEEGLEVLGWRDVPVDPDRSSAPPRAASCRASRSSSSRTPTVSASCGIDARPAGVLPAQARRARGRASTSRRCRARTIVYKGMLTTGQLRAVLPRPVRRALRLRARARALAVLDEHVPVAGRWPTRTGFIAHNGEINTVQGNRNWMRAREAQLASDADPGRPRPALPDLHPGRVATRRPSTRCSSCCTSAAASLPHAVLMMIPEAWENHADDGPRAPGVLRVPLLAHGALGRPGLRRRSPTARSIGAVLDRNGLRPGRYWVTDDGLVVLASRGRRARHRRPSGSCARAGCSRAGCSSSTPPQRRIVERRRDQGRPRRRAARTTSGCTPGCIDLDDLPEREHIVHTHASVLRRQQTFGYTEEELRILLAPMARDRRRAARLDGHRHPDRRALASGRGCSSTTSPSCSRR